VAPRDVKLTVGTISKWLLWLIYAWVVINLVLLFLAFWLRLLGANPTAGFTQWVYDSVSRSMAPFRGIFEPIVLTDESVLDTSLLFAMIVYGLVALFLRAGLDWITDRLAQRRHVVEREVWEARAATPGRAPAPPGSSGAAGTTGTTGTAAPGFPPPS
jgi:uncharacterized protein YggT (Ycf19 family)